MQIGVEYYIMRFLILFEKSKSIDQITFLYNNTMEFRVKEERLKIKLIIFYTFSTLIGIVACSVQAGAETILVSQSYNDEYCNDEGNN